MMTQYDLPWREDLLDKWDFYDKTKEHSTVVIMTGDTRQYANLILKKGVVKPE